MFCTSKGVGEKEETDGNVTLEISHSISNKISVIISNYITDKQHIKEKYFQNDM